jgi:sigma-B regulation protein RsbQ
VNKHFTPDFNHFFSGHLVLGPDREIIFCNHYICELSGLLEDDLLCSSIAKRLSKAANIFVDSYVYPLLINESIAEEIQLTWIDKKDKRTPVIANIKLAEDGLSYWSIYVCTNRDKLQNEWLQVNDKLKSQSKELLLLATKDPLTGLLNRRELQSQGQKLIHQADRTSSTLALMSIDVDFFKRVNDTYGHQAGDNVLINLAKIFTKDRRVNDLVARVGGEEFVLVLPGVNQEDAFDLAEKLREAVEEKSIANVKVTISIGLVVTQKNVSVDLNTLLNASDNALYESKNSGRNKTSITLL